jgi:hypothetical protein
MHGKAALRSPEPAGAFDAVQVEGAGVETCTGTSGTREERLMGYFSNGTEGDMYREAYCDKCKWDKDQKCPIWFAHGLYNYKDCNNPDSILHMLIPKRKAPEFGNGECFFFEPEPSMGLPL